MLLNTGTVWGEYVSTTKRITKHHTNQSTSSAGSGVVDRRRRVRYSVEKYLHVKNMALNIRNPETERLAAALAKLTGKTKTQAVTEALRERLERLRRRRVGRRLADELDEIAHHCAGLPVLDHRDADEVLGYDENGLPR